jgi:hypothetical protein
MQKLSTGSKQDDSAEMPHYKCPNELGLKPLYAPSEQKETERS